METEEKLGVRSTFFFLIESIPFKLCSPSEWKLSLGRYNIDNKRLGEVITNLKEQGWEIGLHGSYRSYNNADLLRKEKMQLERVVGHNVIGIRQHYLNWGDDTWGFQKAVGFRYDSTLGFTNKIGYYKDLSSPFQHVDGGVIEFPLAIMDSCYMETKDRINELNRIVEQTDRSNGVLVLNWHSNSWNDFEFPGYKKNYLQIIQRLLDKNAVFKTLGEFCRDYENIDLQSKAVKKQSQ
ncbi:MAG: hypothetical protein Q8M98_11690 [Candidatus Cloacimonadaceae bacterium]|nr:hypothetical protein [Candidatus Cloacimonadaceae bacterium]